MASSADIATARLRAYLNLPLIERCKELAVFIVESSTTELQHVFPILIDSIFGVTTNVGWGLHNINLKKHPYEHETLCNFFGPQGPIFTLCYKLLPDCYLKYNFPISFLPTKIKLLVEEGIIPPFYQDKLKDDHNTRCPTALLLNPFEYYIFHFAYHLTNPWLQLHLNDDVWTNWETAYVQLAHLYLYHFLPRDNSPVLPIIGPYVRTTPPRKLMQSPDLKRLQTPRLLRTSILSPVSSPPSGVPQQQCLPQVWRSETVVQVFLDFWLEYTEEDKLISSLNPSLSSSLPRRNSIHSGEHIRLVRAFIKTLHEFANSATGNKSAMDELKRIILPSIQGKIYTFLRQAIYHWPLDSSFRLILEAWLSFIQPWRYIPDFGITKGTKCSEEEKGKISDPSYWMPFVANNLLAYTAIFQQLLPRFMRTDLVAPKNALMLFRVTKVFSQPHLAVMLAEAESCISDTSLTRSKISTSQWNNIIRQQIVELEGSTYQYIPMFSATTSSQIIKLLITIKQAYLTSVSIVEALEKRRTERKFFKSLWEFFNGDECTDDDIGLIERKRVPGLLANAQQQLVDIFELGDIPEAFIAADKEYHDSILSTSFCHQSHMNSSMDSSRPGEFVLIRNAHQNCKCMDYMGDPELKPVSSNESAFLVRLLYRFCEVINHKYETKIISMYNRNDFIGRIARKILQPPTTVIQLPKRTQSGFLPREERCLPPRLSLRILARHNFIFTFLLELLVNHGFPDFMLIVSDPTINFFNKLIIIINSNSMV
ncbi:sphingomyelin phosphodiesterase 4 isoform X2 [Microplitis demolitor]|uniref:sphingomyelin phosphodiesterase 4 isoform X2 n=1 Tax=Microplitis demolitor TaxID=69319 RepID=UPI00235B6E10|nr:sphingomyelin phosphodiesterase 4 isoform X2 [Microplitis demolitor]